MTTPTADACIAPSKVSSSLCALSWIPQLFLLVLQCSLHQITLSSHMPNFMIQLCTTGISDHMHPRLTSWLSYARTRSLMQVWLQQHSAIAAVFFTVPPTLFLTLEMMCVPCSKHVPITVDAFIVRGTNIMIQTVRLFGWLNVLRSGGRCSVRRPLTLDGRSSDCSSVMPLLDTVSQFVYGARCSTLFEPELEMSTIRITSTGHRTRKRTHALWGIRTMCSLRLRPSTCNQKRKITGDSVVSFLAASGSLPLAQ